VLAGYRRRSQHNAIARIAPQGIQSFPLLWGTVATFGKPIRKRRRINQ
jgi:hypothetical protein